MTGPLQGGSRRRHVGPKRRVGRRRRRAPGWRCSLCCSRRLIVAGAAYLAFVRDGGAGASGASPLVVGGVADDAAPPPAGGALEPRSPAPVRLSGVDAFGLKFRNEPRAALLLDVKTGEVLYRLNPLRELPMASLTKIMTALVVTSEAAPREPVRITRGGAELLRLGRGPAAQGKARAAGDAAQRADDRVRQRRGDRAGGARVGQREALRGADEREGPAVGSALHPLRLLARAGERQPLLSRRPRGAHPAGDGQPADHPVARRKQAQFKFPIKGGRLYLYGHNPLIRMGYPGAIGLKTGYTNEAGRCFVGVARRGGRTLGVVLLDSPDPGRQARRLLDLGFRYG